MRKRVGSLLLALALCLALTVPAFSAKVDVTQMPGHEVLAKLPDTLQRPVRPATAEQFDYNFMSVVGHETTWLIPQSKESVFQEIVALTDSLTAGETTDTQKVKAIYDWVSQNVVYGDASVEGPLYRNPFYVYVRKSAVCEGYAELCQLMCTIAEIPAVYIAGAEKNHTPGGPGHAWNAAFADGKWIFFDATWKEWDMGPNYHDSSDQVFYFNGIFKINVLKSGAYMSLRTGFQCPDSVTIPDGVTDVSLQNWPNLTSVTIPDGVTSVDFMDCTGLTDVTLPDSVTRICFGSCTSLESIIIPDKVTEIMMGDFTGCTGLKSVTIGSGVTTIWWQAFRNCTSLESVTIPSNVTEIKSGAFMDCTSLESVSIQSSSITKEDIDREGVFAGCTNLKSITFSDGSTNDFFKIENGVLTEYIGYGGSVTIPEGVTKIGDYAFSGCTGLTSVTIPSGVTSIGESAFIHCTSLKSVTIPASVSEMGDNVFNGCESLTSVTIPDGVTKLGAAFAYCTSLTSVTIPGSVKDTSVAFDGCTGLKSVTIQEGVTEIGLSTFYNCTGLTSVTIPNGVTGIDNAAFSGCTSLKSVAIPASVTKINRLAFRGCTGLTDVYYGGSREQWKAINIGENNDPLINATIHYNSPMPQQPTAPTAYSTTQTVSVDGKVVDFYTYEIEDYNYVKLRDLAYVLNGTNAQFQVAYDSENDRVVMISDQNYTEVGGEMAAIAAGVQKPCGASTNAYTLDGQPYVPTAYTIDDYNYIKLRDLGIALNFNVGWSEERGIFIETNKPYDPAD